MKKPNETLTDLARVILLGVMLAVLSYLFLAAMTGTVRMDENNGAREHVTVVSDSLLLNLVLLAAGIVILMLLRTAIKAIPPDKLELLTFAFILVTGTIWVFTSLSAPTYDSFEVTNAGIAASRGDYTPLGREYFREFPFQLGYVLWTQIWAPISVWGKDVTLGLQILNVLCLAFSAVPLMRLTRLIFPERELRPMLALLIVLFPQPVWFCTFVYGNVPAFLFAVWGVYMLALWMKEGKLWQIIPVPILLLISVYLKKNSMIVWVAALIAALLHIIREKKWKALTFVLVLALTVPLFSGVPQMYYEQRSGERFGEGIPMVSWLAMGLSEDSNIYPGWYRSEYTLKTFKRVNFDPEATAEINKEIVSTRLKALGKDPLGAINFFGGKIRSEWNEPTYQSIWTNVVRGNYGEKKGPAKLVCETRREEVTFLLSWMQLFLFAGAAVGVAACLRKKDLTPLLILVTVFGGFLYHALFEAKSQYILFYIVWLLPFAAFGLDFVCEKTDDLLLNLKYTILEAFRPKKAH